MTIQQWLDSTTKRLNQAAIETARLDALVLLEDELGRDKSWVLAHPEYVLQGSELEILSTKIAQRAKHVPLAYIRGRAEFYGREFVVNEHVLVPRPESEAIIDLLKKYSSATTQATFIDVGCGSGALAITAKLELPQAHVIAIDIDQRCIDITKRNAEQMNAKIETYCGDLLTPLRGVNTMSQNIVLLCNLPYVPEQYPINRAAQHEPPTALFSGPEGLDHYYRLAAQLKTLPRHSRLSVITEALPSQHQTLATAFRKQGLQLSHTDGLAQYYAQIPA